MELSKLIVVAILMFGSFGVFALDCERPIGNIYVGYDDGKNQVYVKHGDGYGPSRILPEYVGDNENIMNRALSVLLAGKATGQPVMFRYSEGVQGEVASCTPEKLQKLHGVWSK